MNSRRSVLEANLATVRGRITAACAAVGRDPREVTLIVVTKTWPASDIRILAELGVRDVGENRHQEAVEKAAELADLDLTWHFVGQLQRNKAGAVARYADVVQSVDRPALAVALDRGALSAGRELTALVQVALSEDDGRGGARADRVMEVCRTITAASALRLAGLMAVAPLGEDPATAFARLTPLRAEVRSEFPDATWLSAGMSGDLEAAIAAGATHVRVGGAVLGSRRDVR